MGAVKISSKVDEVVWNELRELALRVESREPPYRRRGHSFSTVFAYRSRNRPWGS